MHLHGLKKQECAEKSIMHYKIVADCLRSNLVHLVKTWNWRGRSFGQSVIMLENMIKLIGFGSAWPMCLFYGVRVNLLYWPNHFGIWSDAVLWIVQTCRALYGTMEPRLLIARRRKYCEKGTADDAIPIIIGSWIFIVQAVLIHNQPYLSCIYPAHLSVDACSLAGFWYSSP